MCQSTRLCPSSPSWFLPRPLTETRSNAKLPPNDEPVTDGDRPKLRTGKGGSITPEPTDKIDLTSTQTYGRRIWEFFSRDFTRKSRIMPFRHRRTAILPYPGGGTIWLQRPMTYARPDSPRCGCRRY